MKRMFVLLAVAVMVASVATAAGPDPWRIKVTDYDAVAPLPGMEGNWQADMFIESNYGTWGASGGRGLRVYNWFGPLGSATMSCSYSASTGAISFGPTTSTSVETWGSPSLRDVLKVGTTYKLWRWTGEYHGQDIKYATSTDGANFSVPTRTTIYGPTITSTGIYGVNPTLTTGGVYFAHHRNSGASYQNAGSKGIMTSGAGETEWWDIDTGMPDPIIPPVYSLGDPIADPHTAGASFLDSNNYARINKACDGNLFTTQGAFREYPTPVIEQGMGLVIGTAGELVGGDHYVWLADVDNSNTTGIGNSLLSAIGLPGLSGPSLRGPMNGYWTGYPAKTVPFKANMMDASSQFLMIYDAGWDTDSSGSGYDVLGYGRAKLLMTKNKADLNYDGTVSFQDIGPFSTSYGTTSGIQANYNPDADMNANGTINFTDIGPFSTRYGTNCSYVAP